MATTVEGKDKNVLKGTVARKEGESTSGQREPSCYIALSGCIERKRGKQTQFEHWEKEDSIRQFQKGRGACSTPLTH